MLTNSDPRAAVELAIALEDPDFTESTVALDEGLIMHARKAGEGVVGFEIVDANGNVASSGGSHASGAARGAAYPEDWPFISEVASFHANEEGKRSVFWLHDEPDSTLYFRVKRELIQSGWTEDRAERSESAFTATSRFRRGAFQLALARFAVMGQTVLSLIEV